MKYKYLVIATLFAACSPAKQHKTAGDILVFDFEAHRGGRGLMPENTIAAMKNAIDLGVVQTLEMDVVISKDKKVVVSHDPYFNAAITTLPSGSYLDAKDAPKTLLYTMPYDSISKYDVGLKPHPDFPQQKKITAHKPLLDELVAETEAYATARNRKIGYNIEIKSKKTTDNTHHPEPKEFVNLVIPVLEKRKVLDRVVIQSFDTRPLAELHKNYPQVRLSFLVDKEAEKVEEQLAKLGFNPDIYSPVYTTVTKEMINECHKRNIKVIPWTANNREAIQKLKDLGADGVISDYPDLFKQIK